MPIHNGAGTVRRAVGSVQAQRQSSWELIAVDDASTDDSVDILAGLSRDDPRIRVIGLPQNLGPSAARNEGMRNARGAVFAYLDCDDEYYPDYLGLIDHFSRKAEVLVFGYDFITKSESGDSPIQYYNPVPSKAFLFSTNVSTPIGVAHRRELYDRLGGFDESLWCLEDWDYWKRLARSGAEFIYLPNRSGLYYINKGSRSRAPRTTAKQQASYEAHWRRGESLYGTAKVRTGGSGIRKVLAVTPHSYFDPEGGGANFASDLLNLLSENGFSCQAFCGSHAVVGGETDPGPLLARLGLPCTAANATLGRYSGRLFYTRHGRVPVTVFRTEPVHSGHLGVGDVLSFLAFYNKHLETFDPDVVVTCGVQSAGDPTGFSRILIDLARRRDVPIVFTLSGHSQGNLLAKIENLDYLVCHFESVRSYFWDHFGIACQFLPPVAGCDHERVGRAVNARYITCIDPNPMSGVLARIVEQLAYRRPEIPLLVLTPHEGRAQWEQIRSDLGAGNLYWAERPWDLDNALSATKILLIPSLSEEPPIPLAMAAMIHGIPVVASNRGSMLDVIGSGGVLLDTPDRHVPHAPARHEREDVEPWLQALFRLWDDHKLYKFTRIEAFLQASRWHPSRSGRPYADFFNGLCPQPGPPVIPGSVTNGGI